MRSRELRLFAVGIALLAAGISAPTCAQTTSAPYASISTEVENYAGPGRASANDLTGPVVRIGLLAPLQGARKAEGAAMVAAAQMALRDAGSRRLSRAGRIVLAAEDSSGPSWGMVSNAVIRLMLNDEAVAVITSTSRADTHLCEQVGNSLGVPVMTLSADPTTTQIDIPWIFRMGPSDLQQVQGIARDIYTVRKLQNVLLITQNTHASGRTVEDLNQAATALGARNPSVIALDESPMNLEPIMKKIETESPQAVVIWTSPATAESLVRALRIAGVTARRYLSQEASSQMHGVPPRASANGEAWTMAAADEPTSNRQNFRARFQQSTGSPPIRVASETYDAVTLTVHALQVAGPNRARVRDKLAKANNYDGVSGQISFDREGNNTAPLRLLQLK
jgi:branched-chain amino acid transport system substrate-binding protein